MAAFPARVASNPYHNFYNERDQNSSRAKKYGEVRPTSASILTYIRMAGPWPGRF